MAEGTEVEPGDILGVVQETAVVEHRIMVPPGVEGRITRIESGELTVEETIAVVETADGPQELTMMQRWPVRRGRPYQEKLPPDRIDHRATDYILFLIARGGTAAIPAPSEQDSGPTPVGEVGGWDIVYNGCETRERNADVDGNSRTAGPGPGKTMQRTVLWPIPDMPVAARKLQFTPELRLPSISGYGL